MCVHPHLVVIQILGCMHRYTPDLYPVCTVGTVNKGYWKLIKPNKPHLFDLELLTLGFFLALYSMWRKWDWRKMLLLHLVAATVLHSSLLYLCCLSLCMLINERSRKHPLFHDEAWLILVVAEMKSLWGSVSFPSETNICLHTRLFLWRPSVTPSSWRSGVFPGCCFWGKHRGVCDAVYQLCCAFTVWFLLGIRL